MNNVLLSSASSLNNLCGCFAWWFCPRFLCAVAFLLSTLRSLSMVALLIGARSLTMCGWLRSFRRLIGGFGLFGAMYLRLLFGRFACWVFACCVVVLLLGASSNNDRKDCCECLAEWSCYCFLCAVVRLAFVMAIGAFSLTIYGPASGVSGPPPPPPWYGQVGGGGGRPTLAKTRVLSVVFG